MEETKVFNKERAIRLIEKTEEQLYIICFRFGGNYIKDQEGNKICRITEKTLSAIRCKYDYEVVYSSGVSIEFKIVK